VVHEVRRLRQLSPHYAMARRAAGNPQHTPLPS
jgi:hypothetical protein